MRHIGGHGLHLFSDVEIGIDAHRRHMGYRVFAAMAATMARDRVLQGGGEGGGEVRSVSARWGNAESGGEKGEVDDRLAAGG
jgi:hypothetical protein